MSRNFSNLFVNIQENSMTENGLSVSIEQPQALLNIANERFRSKPIFILVSGTSESGKSYLGKHFVESGTGNRFKFYKTLADTKEYTNYIDSKSKRNPFDFAERAKGSPEIRKGVFVKIKRDYLDVMRKTGIPVAIVETIKHPWIIEEFESAGDIRILCLFVDAPIDERVKRESGKTGREIKEVMGKTLEKDAWKSSFGNEEVRNRAHLLVNNAGGLDIYNNFLEALELFIRNSSKKYEGTPLDLS